MKELISDILDHLCGAIAYCLPRRVVYWATVRVLVHASCVNPKTEMDALSPAQCLKAWRQQ
jgi:hypothetical protein